MKIFLKKLIYGIGKIFYAKKSLPSSIDSVMMILPHYLGDTLWMLNAVKLMKKYYPEADIDIVLRRDFSPLLNGIIEKEHIFIEPALVSDRKREKFSLSGIYHAAKKYRKKYDVIIDLGGNRYSALFAHCCKAKFTSGFNGDEFGFLYDVRTPDELHEKKYLGLRASLSVIYNFNLPPEEYEKIVVEQPILEKSSDFYRQKYQLPDSKLVLLAPCAGWQEKEWGDEKFRELAQLFVKDGYCVRFAGSPNEYDRLGKCCPDGAEILKTESLADTIGVISCANIFVGNDSGPSHIAATFPACRVVEIYSFTLMYLGAPITSNTVNLPDYDHTLTAGCLYNKITELFFICNAGNK